MRKTWRVETVDPHSKFTNILPSDLSREEALVTATNLQEWYNRHGIRRTVIASEGTYCWQKDER